MITNVGPFPDMDNLVGKSFEFPLLIVELSIALFVPDVLCLVVHVDRRTAHSNIMKETTHKIRQKLTWILGPLDPSSQPNSVSDVLHKICGDHSPGSMRHP